MTRLWNLIVSSSLFHLFRNAGGGGLFDLRHRLLPLFSLMATLSSFALSQNGSLVGTVSDKVTGEPLIGSNVVIVGSTLGASSDLEGKYRIKNIPSGSYSVRATYVGYAAATITNVQIESGESRTVDVHLTPQDITTEEVVVTAKAQMATESALLARRRKASTIGDGISIEQIKRSPDATSADALARVTGVSVVDNKFVFVRGVTDRYNATQLNGEKVTSTDTEVDRKSFTFDIVPAGLLENTIVDKTATPDLPGDFTGGLVRLSTVDFPEKRVLKIGFSGSYNSIITGKDIRKSQGGARDWSGFDDGSRALPAEFNKYTLGQILPNTWAQRAASGPPNGRFEVSYGDAFDLGENQVGFITALNLSNSYDRKEQEYKFFRLRGTATSDRFNALLGGIFDLSFKFGGLSKISFGNLFSKSAQDRATYGQTLDDNGSHRSLQVTEWDERTLYVTSLKGEHVFPGLGGLRFDWRGGYTSSISREPDRKTLFYEQGNPPSKDHSDRSWGALDEYSRSAGVDFTLPIGEAKLKFGGLVEGHNRYYNIRTFLPELDRLSFRFDLYLLPPDSIFMPQNFGRGLLVMNEISSVLDVYDGQHTVNAAYVMVDAPFTLLGDNQFRIAGGVRLEDSDQRVSTISPFQTGAPFEAKVKNTDILPSVNLSYEVNPLTNLRLAYSQSVNRPEFRELASFYFYDYNIYEGVYGNPLLRRALVRNYDVRLETFPGIGEVLSGSFFYKSLTDPIEMKIVISSNPERTWFNSPSGKNYGWELEMRKSLDFLGSWFSRLLFTGNYTRIYSEIEYTVLVPTATPNVFASEQRTRPMQGQSPYMLNLGLQLGIPEWGTSLNILFNSFGRRLDAVGDREEVDVFEEPRTRTDVALTQSITEMVEFKFTAKDIFPEHRVLNTRQGDPYRAEFQGSTVTAKVSLNF